MRPLEHKIVGEDFEYDRDNRSCRLTVECALSIKLPNYQGHSCIGLQIETQNRTIITVQDGAVLGLYMSNSKAAILELRGNVFVIPPPAQ